MLSYKIEHLLLTVLVFFLAWIFFWFLLWLSGFSFLSQSYLYIRVFPSGNLYSESSVLAVVFSLFLCFRIVLLLHLIRRQTIYTTLPFLSCCPYLVTFNMVFLAFSLFCSGIASAHESRRSHALHFDFEKNFPSLSIFISSHHFFSILDSRIYSAYYWYLSYIFF